MLKGIIDNQLMHIDPTKIVFADFETYSEVDIKLVGNFNYAQHPSTEILSLAYKFSTNDTCKLWSPSLPRQYEPCPKDLIYAVKNGYTFVFHNTFFDWLIWNEIAHRYCKYFPYLPLEQTADTMALCAVHALPLKLDSACFALGFDQGKDKEGLALMKQMSKPKKPTQKDPRTRIWDIESCRILRNYNIQDVLLTERIWNTLDYLSEQEHEIWLLTLKMNYHGIPVDLNTAKSIIELEKQLNKKYTAELIFRTKGQVQKGTYVEKIKTYLYETFNLSFPVLDKFVIEKALDDPYVPNEAKRILELRRLLGRSSFAKFKTMINQADESRRVKGSMTYHGATTGRWKSHGLQVQNPIKESYINKGDNPDWKLDHIASIIQKENLDLLDIYFGKDPIRYLTGFIRPCIYDEYGPNIYCADFASIEARCVFWLADEQEALKAYKKGEDLYIKLASRIFNKPLSEVTKKERNDFGKPGILGSGYQMGGAKMAAKLTKETKLDIPQCGKDLIRDRLLQSSFTLLDYCQLFCNKPYEDRELQEEYLTYCSMAYRTNFNFDAMPFSHDYAIAFGTMLTSTYRNQFPKVPVFWKSVELAAKKALSTNTNIHFGKLTFIPKKNFLFMQLPSGRRIAYPNAHLEQTINKFDKETTEIIYYGVDDAKENSTYQWIRKHSYGGLLTENASQGICRDLLAEAMIRIEKAGYKNLFSLHDETVTWKLNGDLEEYLSLVAQPPWWAYGFPIEVEGWRGKRYRK